MSHFAIALPNGQEASITLTHNINTSSAYGLLFSAAADVIAETDSTRYGDYCEPCMIASELSRLGIDPETADIHECMCDN